MRLTVTVLLAFLCGAASAASVSDAKVVFKNDNWSVRRTLDPMTDKPSCVGIYRNRFDVQLAQRDFFITMRGKGGVSAYTLRFDDEPAQPLRLAQDIEKRIGAVNLEYSEFDKLLNSKRLRIRISTLIRGIVDEDISLIGLREAHTFLVGKCMGAAPAQNEPLAAPVPPTDESK